MASADYNVLTPERVSLEYGIAGVGSRGAAAIIDTLIQAVGITVLLIAYAILAALTSLNIGIASGSNGRGAFALAVLALVVLSIFAITSGYFILFEIIWNGQTPGKRILGVRVIRESGYPIRPVDAVIRNLVRIVDWFPVFYGVGVLVMLLNTRSRRLGDFACGTIVVREGSRSMLAPNLAMPEAPDRQAYALSSADATLVRDFLIRRATMHPTARADLARRLATVLSRRYHLLFEDEAQAESFLERLAA